MDEKTRVRIDKVLAEANELVDGGMDEYEAAREALTAQTSYVMKELAVAAVVATVRRRQRADALAIEREAVGTSQRKADAAWKTPEYYAKVDEIDQRMRASIHTAIDRFSASMKAEWTAELLSSEFAMPDGTRVTWGDATVEQHQQRADLFRRNALANAEGAARHTKAIEDLRAAGVTTLSALVGAAA